MGKLISGYTRFTKPVGESGLYVGTEGNETQVVNSDSVLIMLKQTVTAKSTSYSVTEAESGNIFTTTGATGAVTFTLPSKSAGLQYTFINTVDQNMVIMPDATDTIVTFNDVAADSVTYSTANEKIGAMAYVVCDGTKWVVINLSSNTATVAT